MSINCVNSDLYVGCSTLKGRPVYFGFEKVDKENFYYWRHYQEQANYWSRFCNDFCQFVEQEPQTYPNKYATELQYDESQYHAVAEFILKKQYYSSQGPFSAEGVRGGATGMAQVLSRSDAEKKVFMVYASTIPIKERHTKDLKKASITDLANYKGLFGHLIMSFVFLTREESPTQTHYGIFRNPLDFLDLEEKYKGLSMQIHGFGAEVARTVWNNKELNSKKYMVTKPMPSMSKILIKSLGKEHVHCGTNMDLKLCRTLAEEGDNYSFPEMSELLKNYPPIYHINPKAQMHKIAFEEIDLSEHLDDLPDEKAEFIAPCGKSFDLSGMTKDAIMTLVNIEKLATFYLGK